MSLTGRFDIRRTMGGKIVLQVEEEVRRLWPFSRRQPTKRRWRDATVIDLAQPELRSLMDLRYKPSFDWVRIYGQLDPGRKVGTSGVPCDDRPSITVVPEPAAKPSASTTERLQVAA